MLTPDDERTLQVLSDISGQRLMDQIGFLTLSLLRCNWLIDSRSRLTDAGRAKLAELREKENRQ